MKIIIAGERDFVDYDLLCKECNKINIDDEIVSGCARGADKLGEKFASENGIKVKLFPAEWDKYGKSAGYKRNIEMAKYADALIAFWDGKSKGTKHMIDIAKQLELKIKIVKYEIR